MPTQRTSIPLTCLIATLCTALVMQLLPREARAWKPGSHGATANIALFDAKDGHICLPGISSEEIFVGGELTGYYDENGEWSPYNELVSLGAYFRAGANGPDAWPDAVTGQLWTHVDHSRKVPAFEADDFWNDNEINPDLVAALNWIADSEAMAKLPRPITNVAIPQWRSSDWGDEVLRQALAYHREELAGHTRSEALADPRLSMLYNERQASIAFALGYMMHLSGDSFAHAFVNEVVHSPFDMTSGRKQTGMGNLYYTDDMIGAMEELGHIALEKYAHERFVPEVVGEGCEPVDPQWTDNVDSICDGAEPGEFEVSCDYCNPLRGVAGPPTEALADTCDHCFEGCNPWREVCPPTGPEGLPCTECPNRDAQLAACNGSKSCIEAVELQCADVSLRCCSTYAEELVNLGIIEPGEAQDYVCPAKLDRREPDAWEIIGDVRKKYAPPRSSFGPNNCYQGALDQDFELDEPIEVEVDGEVVTISADGFGFTVDLNGDGEPDLINECMLWNCFLSPGSEFCSLKALTNELPSRDLGGGLVCTSVSTEVLDMNPDVLLSDTSTAIPRNFYRKMWLERRYPEGEATGALGTYSLGGMVPNGVYVISDSLKYFEGVLRNFRNPEAYFVAKCAAGWDNQECEIAKKIGAFYAMAALGIVVAVAVATAANLIPFIGSAIAAGILVGVAAVTLAITLFRDHMIPGITLPIEAMRVNLERHLEEDWIDHVITTSQRMAGESCINTCGEFAAEDECTEHRLLGLSGYFTWAEEAFDIVDSLDCNENNYVKRILGGKMNLEDWVDVVKGGGLLIATQYMSCHLADYFYETHFRERVITELANQVRERTTEAICTFVDFYAPAPAPDPDDPMADPADTALDPEVDPETVVDNSTLARCTRTLEALYSDSSFEDDRELLVRLKDLISMLDVGLSDEQRTELYAQINSLLARTAGIQVDFAQLHQLQIALDCSVGLDVDYGDIITDFNAREVLLSTLDSLADDGDPGTVSQGEAAMDSVDRAFGYYDAQMDAVDAIAQGFTDHPFAPIDVNRFAPMYNTIALNKLILLGSGNDRCATLEQECQGDNPPPGCGECGGGDSDDIVITATKEFPTAGIMDLVQKANLVEFGEAYQHAYSTDQLDEDPDTYLQSFFQEQFVEQGSWHGCEDTGFNIACGAFYSIDDPKDYCEALGSWDSEYLKDKMEDMGITNAAGSLASNELAAEHGIIPKNGQPFLMDCAFALYTIDSTYREDRNEYAPNPRHRIGPNDDPHITAYTTPIATDDYLGVDNHRSTTLDRVIKQRAPSYSNWRDWVRDLVHTADTLMFTDGTTTGEPPAPQPAPTEELETYYPHNLTRFSIVNKDKHVSRLYSRIFAPFYCAEVDGTTQYDSDCDSIPNACDNCPLTYNPDQLDSNRDSIGDDCFGFDPYTVPITPTPADKIDIQCSATNPLDVYREIEQNVATMR